MHACMLFVGCGLATKCFNLNNLKWKGGDNGYGSGLLGDPTNGLHSPDGPPQMEQHEPEGRMLFCLEDVMYVCCMYVCVCIYACMYVLCMYIYMYNTSFLPVPTSMQTIFLKEVRNPSNWVKKRLLSQPRLLTKIQLHTPRV